MSYKGTSESRLQPGQFLSLNIYQDTWFDVKGVRTTYTILILDRLQRFPSESLTLSFLPQHVL